LLGGCTARIPNPGPLRPGSATTNATLTRVWSGADSATGLTLQAFFNSAGQADFIRGDGVQFTGPAVFDTRTAANQFVLAVTGQAASGGTHYGIVTVLTAT
jgi:hypothetical protein